MTDQELEKQIGDEHMRTQRIIFWGFWGSYIALWVVLFWVFFSSAGAELWQLARNWL